MTRTKLKILPFIFTTWKRWKKLHPDTLVLSIETGHIRDYSRDPYEEYYRSPLAFFGFRGKSPGLPEKEFVLGIELDGRRRAYPFSALSKAKTPFKDEIAGREVTIHFDSESGDAYATDDESGRIQGIFTYWFVWHSFYPDTSIWRNPKGRDSGGESSR